MILSARRDALARRVVAAVRADSAVTQVEVLEDAPAADDLKPLLEGADEVVVLGPSIATEWDQPVAEAAIDQARRLLDGAGDAGVHHLVVLSTATVYGAWANNPVPLTEEAALRPNPRFVPAVAAAEIERLVGEFRDGHPSCTVAILRPTMAVAEDATSWLARAVHVASGIRPGDQEPPGQCVHLDDLAGAIDLARRARLDGPFNVAPDGWIPGAQLRALAGRPRLRLPVAVVTRLTSLGWRLRLAPAPPGIIPYTVHPWVVANDRLKAAGWTPEHTNEEAYVAGHRPGPFATLSPRRRQELALGGAGVVAAAAATGAFVLIRRLARR